MKQKWFALLLCLLAALCLAAGAACAEEEIAPEARLVFTLPVGAGTVDLDVWWIEEEPWLFLPSFAQLDQLSVEGAELEWWDTEPDEDGMWYVDVALGEEVYEVYVMRSANLRTLFLFSDDPVNLGRAYVEDPSTRHTNEAPASLALVGMQGDIQHTEHIEKLRGRGNGTWDADKRSYQLKLDNRVDLLDTGDPANRARTWLLLAEIVDQTLMHNQISMDLGRELGLNVMESEYVDLYYDGSYRGTYRLSEKVEIGEGRVDELDYDHLLKTWNNKLGQRDLEALPAASAVNRYGNSYHYVDGVVDNNRPDSGAYLVEMENDLYTLTDRCYFYLNNDTDPHRVYALKNPDEASEQAVRYVSELLQEARDALNTDGVNLETGRAAENYFDLEAFARTLLVQELSGNTDGYVYSSSFFVLPAGETCFEPGPLWDLDLAWRYMRAGFYNGADAFKDNDGWMIDFYKVPAFMTLAKQIYCEELYPLVRDVLLGEEQGIYLKPFNDYVAFLRPSAQMNDILWNPPFDARFMYGAGYDYDNELLEMKRFIIQRSEMLYKVFSDVRPLEKEHISLWMDAGFTSPDDRLFFYPSPGQPYQASALSATQLSEATEEEYARWQMEAVVSATDGRSLEGYTVTLNGTPMTTHLQEDGTLLIRAEYEDLSYLPVDYYGEDVGLVFNFERYMRDYPDIAEACDYDEQAVLDYFMDEGVYTCQIGNGMYDPEDVAWRLPQIEDYLYEDWEYYYWEFIEWGFEADWMADTTARFVPEIVDVP